MQKKLRAILQESEAKLEMKNLKTLFNFCVQVGYIGGYTKTTIFGSADVSLPW